MTKDIEAHTVWARLHTLEFSGSRVPEHTQRCICNYFYHKLPPGNFMMSVLSNDLLGATLAADSYNIEELYNIVKWIVQHLPINSYGSKDKVAAWLNS